ncbi:MMPL family transporter [Pseudoalteromonas sp. OOF1S-7]|uniref:efflux RND transporter permease subunit n=1 Tax=Pseudoalteromonas sp. OOF1S-7 TaxID=2917757 RepID=UPI001EF6EEFE|nr:MMPL family transporter [Pseudoalteromonas sp. OOF1S-7]MCG7537515.1 MMPL family transporter [Pseudoalteromonas sp. OOF1S-7]
MHKLVMYSIARPWHTVCLTLMLIVIATAGAFQGFTWSIPFKNDYKVFFREDNRYLNDFLNLQKTYTKSDNVAIVLAPKSGTIFSPQTLSVIQELTEQAWQLDHSTRVDSVSNFQHSYADHDTIIIEDLVPLDTPLSAQRVEHIARVALNEPLLVKSILAPDGSATVVNITFTIPDEDMTEAVPKIAEATERLTTEFASRYPDIEFMLSGIVTMNNSFQDIAISDSATRIPAMLLLVLVLLAVFTRSVSASLISLLIIIVSVVTTIGIWGWLGGELSSPTTTAPIAILTLAVSDCVHVITSYIKQIQQGDSKQTAIERSVKSNIRPIFLTSITTAIGFLTMNFSDSPPFVDLGNLVAIGVMLAFWFTITVLPALMTIFPFKVPVHGSNYALMSHFSQFVIRHHKVIFGICAVSMTLAISQLPKNQLDDDFVDYFDTSVPFRTAADFMEANIAGMTTLELSFDSGRAEGINDPAFLVFIDEFQHWLKTLEDTDHVNSITHTIKRLNMNMHGDDPKYYTLPNSKEQVAQYILLLEMSLPLGLDMNNLLNVDKSATRVTVTFQDLTSNETIALEKLIQTHFNALNSPYHLSIASPSLMFSHIGATNIRSMLEGATTALVLISLLLILALRSLKIGLISLIPNLTPAAVAFGIWALYTAEVGLGLSVVLGVTLGIIVDDTVHFLTRYQHARKNLGYSAQNAIQYSFEVVGTALTTTTVILIAGFLIMATSSLQINAEMGLMTAITISIALLVDFLFLPSLLLLLARDKHAETDEVQNLNISEPDRRIGK